MSMAESLAVAAFAAVITAAGTAYGTAYFLKSGEAVKKALAEQEERAKLAKALHSEISAFMEIYKSMQLDEKVEPNAERKAMLLRKDYTAVYESHSDKIGILNESDIPNIISLYTYIKALADAVTLTNDENGVLAAIRKYF